VITAPVDGVVLARNVDIGQTVAASFQAPVLFVIANDLSQMQVNASIDEADIGRVRVGEDVTFTVDAFPDQNFRGRVEQVRLQPVTTQNVVTYNTIITVDNSSLKLMPGMTATVSVIVRHADNVLRIPTSALRFRPEGFEPRAGTRSAAGQQGGQGGVTPAAGGGGQAGGAGATRARGQGGAGVFAGGGGRPGGGQRAGGGADWRSSSTGGPRPGLVFVLGPDGQPKPTRVKLGISDGRFIEVVDGLQEGTPVVTGTEEAGARPQQAASPGTTNPFQPQRPQPRNR
jgi:HlyD family secretion protein